MSTIEARGSRLIVLEYSLPATSTHTPSSVTVRGASVRLYSSRKTLGSDIVTSASCSDTLSSQMLPSGSLKDHSTEEPGWVDGAVKSTSHWRRVVSILTY